jgi:adenylyl cyclase-associated protein
LEAATSRLEDIAEAQALAKASPAVTAQSGAPTGPAAPAPPPPPQEDPAVVQAYDADVIPQVDAFVKLSGELDPLLKEQVRICDQSLWRQIFLVSSSE